MGNGPFLYDLHTFCARSPSKPPSPPTLTYLAGEDLRGDILVAFGESLITQAGMSLNLHHEITSAEVVEKLPGPSLDVTGGPPRYQSRTGRR